MVLSPLQQRRTSSNNLSPSSNGDGGRAAIGTQEGRRGGHVSSRGMSQLLGGCAQGAPGSLAAALACLIQGGFPAAAPLGHPTGECHSSRDLHSRVLTTCLAGGPSAVCDRHSPPSDRSGGLSRAGHCVSEQLFQVVLPGNPSRFLSGNPGGLPVLPLERRSESDRPPSKHKNLQWIVKQDLLEFNLLSGQTEY